MKLQLAASPEEWSAALQRLPVSRRDALFGAGFHRACARHDEATPWCSIVSDGDAVLMIPGLKRRVKDCDGLWDLQSSRVGCAGPVVTDAADPSFLERAWAAWAAAMASEGAVAALFRLHPVLGNERWLPTGAELRDDRQVCVIDLADGYEAAWAAARGTHRNMVRKARALAVATTWTAPRNEFRRLYDAAMARLGADPELRFGPAFFEALWELREVELVAVVDATSLLAGAVIVWSPICGHYLLAARQPGTGNHLMNLLIDAAIERGVARGVQHLYLGGGRTPAPADSLFRFKRSAATRLLTHRLARVPVNEAARLDLVKSWTERAGEPPTWLLGYRQNIATPPGRSQS